MMPQTQNTDYSNNAMGVAVAPPPGQYSSNTSLSGNFPMLNTSVSNQSIMAALQLNQSNQAYMTAPGLATIGYIYPNGNGYVQPQNLVYNPHNMIHGPMEMVPNVSSSLGHLTNSSGQHNHKLSGFDAVQHFGSISSNQIRKPKNSIMSKTNLYINGLQELATDESVRALVDGIIEPKSCKAMMSHGKCRGSGFIDCATEGDAEKVIQILRNKQMPDGSRLAVKFAYENEKDDLNVYVRNLPRRSTFTNSDLEELFKEYGQVVSVKLLQSDNQYTGTGFVRYSCADEAQRAVDHMNSRKLILGNDDKPVICKLADKGGRRMAHGGQSLSDAIQHQNDNDMVIQQHHSNGVITAHSVSGGGDVIDKLSGCSGIGSGGYGGLQVMAGQAYGTTAQHANNNASWLPTGHASPDMIAQELQSLNLAGAYTALLPALVPTSMSVPSYGDENAAAAQQHVIAQLLWSHNSRMMAAAAAANYQQTPLQSTQQSNQQHQHQQQQHQQQQSHHHHHQQQQQQQQQQQSMLHWSHGQAPTNGGLYYTTNTDTIAPPTAYSQLIYPHHQYANRPPRSVISAANMKSPVSAVMDHHQTAVATASAAVINGQSPSNLSTNNNNNNNNTNQCVVNGNGNIDSPHPANKM